MSSLHERAKEIFLAALDEPVDAREAFVERACGDDQALRREVGSLLGFHEEEQQTDEPSPGPALFTPGDVFAGRYRMIARIGRGGMGDVWRADDLVLQTTVALKFVDSTAAAARQRLLNEVRLARQITHPAVCRVFDVAEAGGGIFYSMELVEGEDLSTLLRRVGRLPSERVADIARQLCEGLGAAHEQGVLHRDLKPANVLIDNSGRVRITDFGIAMPRTSADLHKMTGTPAYMAPEQRTPGAELSERTDLYALGLVLYELLVGFLPPRTGSADLPAPSTQVPNVNAALERIVMQAVSLDPARRPASAGEMAAGLPGARPPTERRHATTRPSVEALGGRKWVAGVALAAAVGLIALAASFWLSPRAKTLTAQDTVVLADFENTTGDTVFDGTMKVALAVALEQSPFLRVFPDERAHETLRLMQRSPDERITKATARDIARREQLKALIAGSIASLGRNYVLTVEAINAESGDVMSREQAEAPSKEQVLTVLGDTTARLRERLGESLASIQKFDVPLPRATTQSLDALHAYSLALSEGREVPRLEAIPHLKRAIELDPAFAMAHALLSEVYVNTGQSSLAPAFSQRAFDLRDRVSERERFFISWRYYRDAVRDWDKALDLARSWTAAYPREAFAFNSLGSAQLVLGRFSQAVDPLREAIRLDPKFVPAYGNLAAALIAVDRGDEARTTLTSAEQQQLDFAGARRLSYLIAFVENDQARMARELERSIGARDTNAALGWQAHTSAFGGRIAAAHEQFERGVQMARQSEFDEVAGQLAVEDAEIHALAGQCDEARREAASGLTLSRDNVTLERAARALAWCGEESEALELSAELGKRSPEATLTRKVALPVTAAAAAVAGHRASRAVELLEPSRPYEHAPSAEFWPSYVRGSAYLQLQDGARAAAEFHEIADHPGEVPAAAIYPLSRLGLMRAALLQGDHTEARKQYEALMKLWSAADQDLPLLKQARAEMDGVR